MPYFDYKCNNCGLIVFDVYRNIKDNTQTYECPICKKDMNIRYDKKSASSFELKGSGGYKSTKK